MMGRVKDYYWDEICARHDDYGAPGDEPDLLEMLAIDAQMAVDRYQRELAKRDAEKGSKQ
jgi:hypothetical protein